MPAVLTLNPIPPYRRRIWTNQVSPNYGNTHCLPVPTPGLPLAEHQLFQLLSAIGAFPGEVG